MELEAQLKNLRCLKADEEFKQNLRKRILNEYSFVHAEKVDGYDKNSEKTSLFSNILSNIQAKVNDIVYGFFKFNSALSLSVFVLLFISVASYASILILPDNVKTTVSEGFKSMSKPSVDFEVVSNIDGASVYINDKYVGLTPLDINVKEGAYSIRVEKDGYIAYESDVSLDTEKLSNKLNIELPKQVTASKWMKYENKENGISFFYPDGWNLIEKKLENQRKLSQIIIESGNTSLGISLNDGGNADMLNPEKEAVIVGEIQLNNKVYKRYLAFNQFNEFALGGIWIDHVTLGKLRISYNFGDLPQSQIISSEQLNLLDKIAISFLSSQSEDYIYNPDSFKPLENKPVIVDPENIEDAVDTIEENGSEDPEEEIEAVNEYINNVYGYKLNLPEKWFISSSRAEYPLYDRGHLIDKDGKSYKIARLKIYSDKEGIMYLFMTNDENNDINDGGNLCAQETDKKIINIKDNLDLVGSSSTTKYNYQLCAKTDNAYSSEFTVESAKNGKIRYTIYWDAAEAEVVDTLDSFNFVLDSIKFDDRYVSTPIDKVKYTFKENGITFNYNYAFNIVREDGNCGETIPTPISASPLVSPTLQVMQICKIVKVTDNSGNTLVEITDGGKFIEPEAKEGEFIRKKDLKNMGTVELHASLQNCKLNELNEESCSIVEKFLFGVGVINRSDKVISIKYYKNSENVYSILTTLKLL